MSELELLIEADRHVAEGEQQLGRQCALIDRLAIHGHDTAKAEALLSQFQQIQAMHIAHRDRLRRDLDTPEPTWRSALIGYPAAASLATRGRLPAGARADPACR
jgi:hypothetical protein